MLISGHKTRSVFDRHNVVSERDLQEVAAKLERHVSELEKAHDKDKTRYCPVSDSLAGGN